MIAVSIALSRVTALMRWVRSSVKPTGTDADRHKGHPKKRQCQRKIGLPGHEPLLHHPVAKCVVGNQSCPQAEFENRAARVALGPRACASKTPGMAGPVSHRRSLRGRLRL
jgi:hypothetical protein